MATFMVPQNNHVHEEGAAHAPGGPANGSRRSSASLNGTNGEALAVQPRAFHPMEVESDPRVNQTVVQTDHHPVTVHTATDSMAVASQKGRLGDKGWSKKKKICCGCCLFFLAILITIGVLIAFLVRAPSITFDKTEIICPNNDIATCASKSVLVRVTLQVDNPNIIGVTVNADLELYNDDRTTDYGPGVIDETTISKQATTPLIATFTVTSSKGAPLLAGIYGPGPAPKVRVDGTIYFHLGALKPSYHFSESFTVPKG
jgi:biopolymer transport protein ExbD